MEKKHKLAAVVLGIAAVCTIGLLHSIAARKNMYPCKGVHYLARQTEL